jgi:hypothetical protein
LYDPKEIKRESFWRIRAYKKAIDSIRELDIPITNVSDLHSIDNHSTDQYIWQKNAVSLVRRAQLTKNDLHKVRNNE